LPSKSSALKAYIERDGDWTVVVDAASVKAPVTKDGDAISATEISTDALAT
jgi:hypothetical protein